MLRCDELVAGPWGLVSRELLLEEKLRSTTSKLIDSAFAMALASDLCVASRVNFKLIVLQLCASKRVARISLHCSFVASRGC